MAGSDLPAGALVTLSGLQEKILPDEGEEPLDFNGAKAQLTTWNKKSRKWSVLTLGGYSIQVSQEHCQLLTSDDLGGCDLFLGPGSNLEELAKQTSSLLVDKAFCSTGILLSQDETAEIFDVAKTMEEEGMFTRLPLSFEAGYLGKGGKGKVSLLESAQEETPEIVLSSALPAQDQNLSTLSELLAPLMRDSLGFEIYSRSNLMLQLSFSGLQDEARYVPPTASPKDADSFLALMGRRKMAALQFVGPGTSELQLVPKAEEFAEVSLLVQPNTLVLILTDFYDYSLRGTGETLTLQSFFLERPLEFKVEGVGGNLQMLAPQLPEGAPPPAGESIVVRGLASRDPCCADMHEKLWTALRHGGCDGFLEIPHKRFDVDLYINYLDQQAAVANNQSYCRHQGQCEGLEIFDASFFNIPDQEVYGMDPEQRILMETGWMCLSNAGYDRRKVQKDSAHLGVFVGISSSDWRDCCVAPSANGVPETFIANRFSYAINLKGPSFIVNTACSASLVATHSAKIHLLFPHDPLEGCVCAGISLNLSPGTWVGNCSGNMLSFRGRSFTFNSTADGYGRGEGCASMVIAKGEYDPYDEGTYCLLAGTHTNSDGRSASLTAPNGPAQQRLLRAVLTETQLQPVEICVYEAHGTGTSLGDPIEVGAVRKVLNQRAYPIMISCSKTSLGHLEGGAGMSSFCKCVMAVMHCECAPNQHLREQNPHLDIDGWPGMMLAEAQPMKAGSTYVGVSGFGYGGTNSHALAYGKNVVTSRGLCETYAKEAVLRKVRASMVPEIWMEGDNYEDWVTSGVPYLSPGQTYNVEVAAGGKAVWREAAVPELPENVSFHIQGTMSSWELLNLQPSTEVDGLFTYEFTMSSLGQESFQIAVDHDPELNFYPAEETCSKRAVAVLGPAPAPSREYAWVVRGNPGTKYTVEVLRTTPGSVSVSWLKTPSLVASVTAEVAAPRALPALESPTLE